MTTEIVFESQGRIDTVHRTTGRYAGVIDTVTLMILREWHRLLMEPSRMFGVLLQPLLFLLVFGVGFHDSFRIPESNLTYVGFFFPGILGMVVLFSSIYATLTLVDDKKCGFFRLVLSGPGGVLGAIFGKIVATTTLGFVQSLLFLPIMFFLPVIVTMMGFLWLLLLLLAGSLCFALIGVLFAWICETPSAFHALMSVILLPMWMLSGAMFPVSRGILWWLSLMNPMAYLVEGLRGCMGVSSSSALYQFAIILVFCLINFLLLLKVQKLRPVE